MASSLALNVRMQTSKRAQRTWEEVFPGVSDGIACPDRRKIGPGGYLLSIILDGVWFLDR